MYARALALAVETGERAARGDGGAEPRRDRQHARRPAGRARALRVEPRDLPDARHARQCRSAAQQHGARLHAARAPRRSASGVRRSDRSLRRRRRRAAPAARADELDATCWLARGDVDARGGAVRHRAARGHRGRRRTRARRDVQVSGRHRARARRLDERRAPPRRRRTTTRCAAKTCCSPPKRRASRPSCSS